MAGMFRHRNGPGRYWFRFLNRYRRKTANLFDSPAIEAQVQASALPATISDPDDEEDSLAEIEEELHQRVPERYD